MIEIKTVDDIFKYINTIKDAEELVNYINNLEQRLNKAIEFFSIFEELDCVINGRTIKKGLNILRGEDK